MYKTITKLEHKLRKVFNNCLVYSKLTQKKLLNSYINRNLWKF